MVLALHIRGLRVGSHGPRYRMYCSDPLRQVGVDRVKYNSRRYGMALGAVQLGCVLGGRRCAGDPLVISLDGRSV